MPRRPLALAAIALSAGALASGCGGSSTSAEPDRQAAAAGDTRTCPPRNPSFTYEATIANLLSSPIMLRASEYDCNDWDGIATPGRTFTGQVLKPGATRTFFLQPVSYYDRNWTMEIVDASGGTSLGRARLSIPRDGIINKIEVHGSQREKNPSPVPGPSSCDFLPLERTGSPSTPWDQIKAYVKVPLSVVSRDGRVTLASRCWS